MRRWLPCLLVGLLTAHAWGATSTSLDVSWTAPTTLVDGSPMLETPSYRLYFSTPCPSQQYATVAQGVTSVTVNGLLPSTTYTGQITAVNSAGESLCSAVVSGTTLAAAPLLNLTNLSLLLTDEPLILGEPSVLPEADSGNGGLLIAQSAVLAQAATLQSLSFYVTNAAGLLRLGIYDASGPGGGPGQKKAETAEITPVAGWNTRAATAPVILSPGTYWLAYLASDSALAFVKAQDGTSRGVISIRDYGALPQTFPTAPFATDSHWSFYATLR